MLGIGVSAWVQIAIVSILMIATFRFNLIRLWGKTNPFDGESEWRHAIVVPFIGLYYLYVHRDELLAAKIKPLLLSGFDKGRMFGPVGLLLAAGFFWVFGPSLIPSQAETIQSLAIPLIALSVLVVAINWGLAMTVFGLVFFAYGIYPGQNDYFKDLGMVCTLFGVVLTLCGWQIMRVAWFPIAFLICALPWPGLFYSWVAGPLQFLAAKVAVGVLSFAGVDAFQSGTKINMNGRALNVAEACAGLKSLMTFITVAAAVAFLSSSKTLWQKLVMVACAVPVAIFCNVLRVSGQGLIDARFGHEWSENFAHQFVGMVMLMPAFFMILTIGWILEKLFEDEADADTVRAATLATTTATRLAATTSGVAEVPTMQIPVSASRSKPSMPRKIQSPAQSPNRTYAATEATESQAGPAVLPPPTPPPSRLPRSSPVGKRGFIPPALDQNNKEQS